MQHDRLLKHGWGYEALGRKGNTTVTSPHLTADAIELAYDSASRLTQERLMNDVTPVWSADYDFDAAGNRKALDDGDLDLTFTYGTGNRETANSASADYVYDFKGNVALREPLSGGKLRSYDWNERDQLINDRPAKKVSFGH